MAGKRLAGLSFGFSLTSVILLYFLSNRSLARTNHVSQALYNYRRQIARENLVLFINNIYT